MEINIDNANEKETLMFFLIYLKSKGYKYITKDRADYDGYRSIYAHKYEPTKKDEYDWWTSEGCIEISCKGITNLEYKNLKDILDNVNKYYTIDELFNKINENAERTNNGN